MVKQKRDCTLCAGTGDLQVLGTTKFGAPNNYRTACRRCKGTGELNRDYEISVLRKAQAIIEGSTAMVELSKASSELSAAIVNLQNGG